MAGVLAPLQTYIPNLRKTPIANPDSNVSYLGRNSLLSTVKVTPPEFIQSHKKSHNSSSNTSVTASKQYQNLLNNRSNEILSGRFLTVDNSQHPQETSNEVQEKEQSITAKNNSEQVPEDSDKFLTTQAPPTISFGSKGVSVRILQQLLSSNGYGVGINGKFTAVTEIAVKSFQGQRNLEIDGVVGPSTWSELTKSWD
jgi:murein L,D-transpeptidase YcbB/YkuD